jgi:hypothetical protein
MHPSGNSDEPAATGKSALKKNNQNTSLLLNPLFNLLRKLLLQGVLYNETVLLTNSLKSLPAGILKVYHSIHG